MTKSEGRNPNSDESRAGEIRSPNAEKAIEAPFVMWQSNLVRCVTRLIINLSFRHSR